MRILPCWSYLCDLISYLRPWSFVVRTPPGALALVFGLSAHAGEPQPALYHWGVHTFSDIESCAGVFERSDNELSAAADCVSDRVLSGLLDGAFQLADKYGKSLLGSHFRLDRRLDFSTTGQGFSGELDAVIPLNSFTSISGDRETRAVFLQNGLSQWRDEHGFQRNDLRFGVVHRIAVSEQPGAGIFGASLFFQENLERGHARIVPGLDYSYRWGSGALRYFMPVTGWRDGRLGYEERALEGVEFNFRSDLTRTVELEAATGQWESKDGSGDWNIRGRFGVRWQPHLWFALRGSWDIVGTADDSWELHLMVSVPFGGNDQQRTRWRGLGLTGLDSNDNEVSSRSIWNSVDNVGRIEITERGRSTRSEQTESDDSGSLLDDMFAELTVKQP